MNKAVSNVLNYISEGIVILDKDLNIILWNKFMEDLTDVEESQVLNTKIFQAIPKLNKPYYKKALNATLKKDYKYFFSSEIHKNIISKDLELNIRVQKIHNEGIPYLMIEFIDMTIQHIRIGQLKGYVSKLNLLNQQLKDKEKQIEKLAYYDKLTNLTNRTLFSKVGEKLLANAKRRNSILGLMFIDIDTFKNINDSYGHLMGDKVLIEIAKIITDSVRDNDIVSRYGGDEFLVLLPDLKDYDNYKNVAERIAKRHKSIKINGDMETSISLSIGVSFYPRDGNTIAELISKADQAMYKAKEMGGDEYIPYSGY